MLLLALLEQGPMYGYQLRAEFERRTGSTWPLKVGQVYINGADFNPVAPFGGYKQSGNGRELGRAGVEEFTELKAILK